MLNFLHEGWRTLTGLRKAAVVCCLPLVLTGCATLPGHGPSAMDIALHSVEANAAHQGYVMVPMDTVALSKINSVADDRFSKSFAGSHGPQTSLLIGIGDELSVNIWEASADGLFSTEERRQTALQAVVDETGQIFIPYVGRLTAAGRNVEALRQSIEAGLAGQAVEPQVQVVLSRNVSNNVVVVGDVSSPGQYPLALGGVRLMDAIALAGGARETTYESIITLTRGTRQGSVRLDEVAGHPQNNIWLAPGDNVTVIHQPRSYSAFGAVQSSQLVPFATERVTLSEALAKVGGLRDATADTGGVFVFRFERAGLAQSLNPHVDLTAITTHDGVVPVIYRLDFSQPQAFFLAQSFSMRDKDVLYVANHPTVEMNKFLSTIVSPLLGTTRTVQVIVE